MNHRVLLSLACVAVTTTAAAAQVRHVPPAEATAGEALELVAQAPATTPALVAMVRTRGAERYTSIELVRRDGASWVAVVPATVMLPPGVDYYLVAGDQPVFASPEWPHAIAVAAALDEERRQRDALRVGGRRSRVNTAGEWVNYGRRAGLDDRYYRLDIDFSYRLWAYPLEQIRVGYTRLIGETQAASGDACVAGGACTGDAGFKVAGWFELGLAVVEGLHVDGRMIVMATQEGFAVGGRGEGRLGDRTGSHVAVGAEYLADVGSNGFFRLGWGTVPRLPMAATVEITNLPASYRPTGVRLYYDLSHELRPGVRVGLRVGYAARTQLVSGFTGGAGASLEF